MRLTLTAIVGIDTRFEFVCTQQPVRFGHSSLAMHPFRFDAVQPGTRARHGAPDQETAIRLDPVTLRLVEDKSLVAEESDHPSW
jgi:hypothetical protein